MPVWMIKKNSPILIKSYSDLTVPVQRYDIMETHTSTENLTVTEKNFNGYGRSSFRTIAQILEYVDSLKDDESVTWKIDVWRIEVARKFMERLA